MRRGRHEKVRHQVPVEFRDRQRFSCRIRPSLTHEMPDTRWAGAKSRLAPRLRQMLTGQQVRGSRLITVGRPRGTQHDKRRNLHFTVNQPVRHECGICAESAPPIGRVQHPLTGSSQGPQLNEVVGIAVFRIERRKGRSRQDNCIPPFPHRNRLSGSLSPTATFSQSWLPPERSKATSIMPEPIGDGVTQRAQSRRAANGSHTRNSFEIIWSTCMS